MVGTQAAADLEELWALAIYALAGEGTEVEAVSVAQLRYRLDDQARFTAWLWAGLDRLGHPVRQPSLPKKRGIAADAEAALTSLTVVAEAGSPASDDPVTRRWSQASALTAGSAETSNGMVVTFRPGCELWRWRARTIPWLDAVLVLDRGGWPAGARVRTRGIPHMIDSFGRLAQEIGVAPDRAVIVAPAWQLDHDRHTVVDGPPRGYHLRYRELATGLPADSLVGPVAVEHLVVDLAPFPEPAGSVVVPSRRPANLPDPVGETVGDTANGVVNRSADSALASLVDTLDSASAHAGDSGPTWSMAATSDPLRAAAIRRVWSLRDDELARVGDSTPQRVAQRVAAGDVLAPEGPLNARELAANERGRGRATPERALWCPPDQHLVTGRPREQLRQWLEALSWCTGRQRRVLDGLTPESTMDDVRQLLVTEGFVEVLVEHDNADAGRDYLDVIAVNTDCGWLAVLRGSGACPEGVTVYYNAMAVDEELMPKSESGGWHFDKQRRRSTIWHGSINVNLCHSWTGMSLRTHLAGLRAFGTPVTPWVANPHVHVGADETPRAEQRRRLASLPAPVHELFGPYLLPSA